MSEIKWEATPELCSTHGVVFALRDPSHGDERGGVRYEAYVKWDGCVELLHTFNIPLGIEGHRGEDEQQFHICDIDYLCEILQSLKHSALTYFADHEFGIGGVPHGDVLAAIKRTQEAQ